MIIGLLMVNTSRRPNAEQRLCIFKKGPGAFVVPWTVQKSAQKPENKVNQMDGEGMSPSPNAEECNWKNGGEKLGS